MDINKYSQGEPQCFGESAHNTFEGTHAGVVHPDYRSFHLHENFAMIHHGQYPMRCREQLPWAYGNPPVFRGIPSFLRPWI